MFEYFKSTDQQIDILKSRGLIINDEKRAKEVLLRYNYYKIINATLPFFTEKSENGKFKYRQGTDFLDLYEVHHFDKELKKILLAQMLEIERIARSIISYKFTEKYPQKNSYLNADNYYNQDRSFIYITIDSIKETIEKYREEDNFNKSINYYMNKYGFVPFWFIINFLSFGRVVNIYEILDYKLKEDIADEFQKFVEGNLDLDMKELLTPTMLESFFKNAKEIRNIAAHDNLILGYDFDDVEYFQTIHSKFGIKKRESRRKLFDSMVILQALIPQSYYKNIAREINSLIEDLRSRIDTRAFDLIMDSIGYRKEVD